MGIKLSYYIEYFNEETTSLTKSKKVCEMENDDITPLQSNNLHYINKLYCEINLITDLKQNINGPSYQPFLRRDERCHISEVSSILYLISSNIRKNHDVVTFGCKRCKTHLATSLNIISKDFRSSTGIAFLMSSIINIIEKSSAVKHMITGQYLISTILCHLCKSIVGWKYLKAQRDDQRFKEGMYVLELQTVTIVT